MQIKHVPTLEGLKPTPSILFENSMAGPVDAMARVDIWSDTTQIRVTFEVEATALFDQAVNPGEFHRGLWKFDCGELWLGNPSTGRYLEFNLAPNGAWWAMAFSGVRIEDPSCPPPDCVGIGKVERDKWTASLTTTRAEIRRCLGSDTELTGNLTLVLGGCPDVNPPLENFSSLGKLGGVQPDFHRPGDWTPITFSN